MKNFQFLALASIAALAMGSCSNDDMGLVGDSNELRVNGTINEIKTRATDTEFQSNDQIGVSVAGGAQNVLYAFNGTDFTAAEPIKVKEAVQVTAYYPYSASLEESNEIDFNVSSDANVDFLFAPAVSVSAENATANFRFSHKMTKLAFTLEDADDQFVNDETFTVSIKEVVVDGKFNAATGVVTPGSTTGSITKDITTASPVSIILPSYSEANQSEIEVQVGVSTGEFYTAKITPALAAGTQYNVTLTISANSSDMDASGSITDWEKEEMGSVDMTPQEPERQENVVEVGDFLLADGTTIDKNDPTFSQYKDQVVGVVFYAETVVDGFENGLAVALENACEPAKFVSSNATLTEWYNSGDFDAKYTSLFHTSTSAVPSEMDGFANTQILKENGSFGCLSALTEYNSTKSVDSASEWYLPSYAELAALSANFDIVSASLEKASGSLEKYDEFAEADSKSLNNLFYWSSDAAKNDYTWAHPLAAPKASAKDNRVANTNTGNFRFVIAF